MGSIIGCRSFGRYGRLANRKIDELEAGARIEVDENKEDPLDFALWKFAKPGEPRWPFPPHGDGRPGWHIECSAMSRALLDPQGEGFDIHGGGADLIFPHHENEIAQSEPLMTRPPMANVWVHGGLLLFDNRKMAKSLGNFEPLSDLLRRHDPQAIRWLFLQTGYRKVMNFTEDSIAAAAVGLARIKTAYRAGHPSSGDVVHPERSRGAQDDRALRMTTPFMTALAGRMEAALDDDMNTAAALAVLYDFAAQLPDSDRDPRGAADAVEALSYWLGILGVKPDESWLAEAPAQLPADFLERLSAALGEAVEAATPPEAIERVIAMRSDARRAKDWEASDRLRDALAGCGVELKDSKEGTTWTIAV